MIRANYHTHTVRCHHAVGSEREYIEQAIAEGFDILGFSDHTPQPYPENFRSGVRMDMYELGDQYKNSDYLIITILVTAAWLLPFSFCDAIT